jgi:dnd system-associated protein 4
MKSPMTIAETAAQVLRENKKPMSVESILTDIEKKGLYTFNTPDPVTVLREQIRRHCADLPERDLSYEPILFHLRKDGLFELLSKPGARAGSTIQLRRVQRATDKEDVIRDLHQGGKGFFQEIWQIYLFAAALGILSDKREPLGAVESGKGIDERVFSKSPVWPGLLHLMAIVEKQQPDILFVDADNNEFQIKLLEEYANAGLAILRTELESSTYNLDSIVKLISHRLIANHADIQNIAEINF